MTIGCSILGHVARGKHHHNDGIDFSICHRCGEDLIRVHGDWTVVPKGLRVVWREKAARRGDAASVARRIDQKESGRPKARALPAPARPRKQRNRPLHAAQALAGLMSGLILSSIADRVRGAGEAPAKPGSAPEVIYLPAR